MGGLTSSLKGNDSAADAANISANAMTEASRIQSDAALRGAEISAAASLEGANAMAASTDRAAQLNAEAARRAIAEQRRQFDFTSKLFQPYVDLGADFIGSVSDASTLQGFDNRIGQIQDSSVFNDLFGMRQDAADNYYARIGGARSGAAVQEAAQVPVDLAMAIENQLFGRQLNNVNIGQNSVARVGAAGQGFADSIANIEMNSAGQQGQLMVQGGNALGQGIINAGNAQGQSLVDSAYYQGAGITGAANAQAEGIMQSAQNQTNSMNAIGSIGGGIFGGMMGGPAGAQAGSAIGGQLGNIFFSDERLKVNMERIGEIGGLSLYEWDWLYPDEIGMEMSLGFKAQEVKEKYPEYTYQIGNFLAIDYPALTNHLDSLYG